MDPHADDRDRLFNAAASICDGTEIDWTDVRRAAVDDETTAIVMQLEVVERIARLHSGSRRINQEPDEKPDRRSRRAAESKAAPSGAPSRLSALARRLSWRRWWRQ